DAQLSGKLLKIDLNKLAGMDFTGMSPVATFDDLKALQVPDGAFTPLVKGLRNPSKVHHERIDSSGGERIVRVKAVAAINKRKMDRNGRDDGNDNHHEGDDNHQGDNHNDNDQGDNDNDNQNNNDNDNQQEQGRFIKYLANTGQDTIEFIHGFVNYGINF